MDEKFRLEIEKLISGKAKLSQGFCEAKFFNPDPANQKKGWLFFALEIASIDPKTKAIADEITARVKGAYFEDPAKDALSSLEDALKEVNDYLTELFHDGDTFWLGKINAVIAVLAKRELHLTAAGSGLGYLDRDSILVELTEDLAPETPDPLKTFLNITSGKLEIGDKLLFTTPGLSFHFSKELLGNILANRTPAEAIREFSELMGTEENEFGSSFLVAEVKEKSAEPELFENLESKQQEAAKEISGEFEKEEVPTPQEPVIQTDLHTAPPDEKIELASPEESDEAWIKESDKPQEKLPKAFSVYSQKAKEFLAGAKSKISKPKSTQPKTEGAPATSGNNFFATLKELFSKLAAFLKSIKSKTPTEKKKLLRVAGIAILIFFVSLGLLIYKSKTAATTAKYEGVYKEAVLQEQNAENALIYKDKKQAQENLNNAIALLKQLEGTKYKQKEIAVLLGKINDIRDRAYGILQLSNLTTLTNFSEAAQEVDAKTLLKFGDSFYAFDSKGNRILEFNQLKGAQAAAVSVSLDGEFKDAAFDQKGNLVIYTATPGVFEYSTKAKTIAKKDISGGAAWGQGEKLANYKEFIYLLSPAQNQIFRYSKTQSGYTKASNYITKNVDLSKAAAISIPDFVYVLGKDGSILKFAKGTSQKFEITNLPTPFNEPTAIYALPDGNIYVADPKNKRIVMLDKTGSYQQQFSHDELEALEGFWVDEKTKKLYFLANNKLQSASMEETNP